MDEIKNINKKESKGSNKKKKAIIIGSCIAVVVIVLIVLLVFVFGKDKNKQVNSNPTVEEDVLTNWDNRIVDLENEPVSDMDVVYKEKNSSTDKPYVIQVNKSQNCIIIYKKDKNGKYTEPYKAMICSVGFDTPIGEFKISDKYEWKIVNGNVWAQYATRVVGNVLFHSMPYSSNSKDTLISKYYNQMGSTLSSSCIRMSARDSEWIMKNCPAGTLVQIYESESEEPLKRPKSMIVPEDAVWDPTDSDPANPYKNVQISFEGIESQKVVERGTQINYLDGVTVKDTCGNDISSQVDVNTNLDAFTLGSYEVKYFVEDAAGKTAEASVTYQIVDTMAPEFSGLKSKMEFGAVADVTKDNILKGVYAIDNNEVLDSGRIAVTIPTIVEGDNTITLAVTDDYNNTTTVTVTASVHVEPPVISLKPGMETILPLTQKVDKAFALSRVTATDDGNEVPADRIDVTITQTAWGYSFKYSVTDENGYSGVLNDSVSYVEYSINPPKDLVVTSMDDREQLLKGVQLNNNLGGSMETSAIEISVKYISGDQYQVTYSYTYTSPIGDKTTSANAVVTCKGEESEEPSATPVVSEKPIENDRPQSDMEPDNPEEDEINRE